MLSGALKKIKEANIGNSVNGVVADLSVGKPGKKSASAAALPGANPAQIYGVYAQLAAQQQADAQRVYDAQRAAAEEAYNMRENARLAGYGAVSDSRQQNHSMGVNQLNTSVDTALQQAYIAKSVAERNIAQQLSAMGQSGGTAESTLLGLAANYGSNRGQLETARAEQTAAMALALQQGLAGDKKSYEDARASDSVARFETISSLETGYAKQVTAARQKLAEQQAALLLKQLR